MPEFSGAMVRHPRNNRLRLALAAVSAVFYIAVVLAIAASTDPAELSPAVGRRNELPSVDHWLGTDWLGRDLAARTFVGMRLSLWLGFWAALGTTVLATFVALIGGLGPRWADRVMSWLTDATLGLPQVVLSLLISFAVGGGEVGVVTAIACTGWPPLARLLRAEILSVRSEVYVEFSRAQGKSSVPHIIAAILPQVLVGLIVAFPHSIVHESMLTFLGFGIEPTTPSLGIVLSEGLRYLTNDQWWAVLGPITLLVILATVLDRCGDLARYLLNPATRHQ